jgi:hypothetical protein
MIIVSNNGAIRHWPTPTAPSRALLNTTTSSALLTTTTTVFELGKGLFHARLRCALDL